MTVDVVVIGAGAAGLTAGLFSARRGMSTVIIGEDLGGQASLTNRIENYPGVSATSGFDLMHQFAKQAQQAGATLVLDRAIGIIHDGEAFIVKTHHESYATQAVIVASGLTHRQLGVPGEKELTGRGVSYCATCDAPLFRGRDVAVVGGGNSAMDAALLLSSICPRVHLVTINSELIGERVLVDRVNQATNLIVHTAAKTIAILGTDHVTGIDIESEGRVDHLAVAGVFVEVGYAVDPSIVHGLVELDQKKQIVIHPTDNSTTVAGVFAAGDITTIAQKQIVISAGEGAKAALGAVAYLLRKTGRPAVGIDWTHDPVGHTNREPATHLPTSQRT